MNEEMMKELQSAAEALPDDVKQQLFGSAEEAPVDSVAVKMELIKFVTELLKHNQACDWETNKVKPKKITFEQIISNSQDLYDFVTE